ncbi:MAG: glycosyltransferase [Acidimicrobiales bacterium]
MSVPRRFRRGAFDEGTLAGRTSTVAAVLVARNEATTIARALAPLQPLRARGLLDRLVVVDGGSVDGTADLAEAAGAEVLDAASVLPELGPVLGKGDSIWRTVVAVEADVLAFLDADLIGRYDEYVLGLLGPLLVDPDVRFVKGAFRRTRVGEEDPRHLDGGRVTEMVARPLLNLLRPDLAAFYQPLGGQVAARRRDLAAVAIPTGYAVEIDMLATMVDRFGHGAVVESDLGRVVNRERTVEALVPMAQEVMYGLLHAQRPGLPWTPYVRPEPEGGMAPALTHEVVHRPPAATLVQGLDGGAGSRRRDIGSS